jgi:hypothetical protein
MISFSHAWSRTITVAAFVLILAGSIFAQTLDKAAIQNQQRDISTHILTLRTNFLTFWMVAYPNGPLPSRDKEAERKEAWNPKLDIPKGVVPVNTNLGCITFIVPNGLPPIPDNCAPLDVQARLGMEALREDWENGRNVPEGQGDLFATLRVLRNGIPELWGEEKTLYCVLRPEAQYIDLDDTIKDCTRKEKQ